MTFVLADVLSVGIIVQRGVQDGLFDTAVRNYPSTQSCTVSL